MKIVTLFAILCLAFTACNKILPLGKFEPAKLKARVAALYPLEFAAQQKKYDDAVKGISVDVKNPKNYCALAKVFMYEAKVTGDHPYYYPAAMSALDAALHQSKDDFREGAYQALLHESMV